MKELKSKIAAWRDAFKGVVKTVIHNKDLLVFLLFVVLATALWFLNALRKEYTTTVSYPIRYSQFPDDFILLGKPMNSLELKIKSHGYTVLPYHMGKILDPEELNVSSFKRIKSGDTYGAFLSTRDLLKSFSDKLINGVELLQIYPDTLFVYFEKKERKKVPVRFNSKLSFEPQFYQFGEISIQPDSIEVSGPESVIDSLDFVYTELKTFEGLNDSLVRNVSVEGLENVEMKPSRVVVSIPVEPFTQKNITISINDMNVPDSLKLKTFPSEVSVSFTVAVSQFNKISSDDFATIVDYDTKSTSSLPDRLKVKLLNVPDGIKDVNYTPLFVECLFEKVNYNE